MNLLTESNVGLGHLRWQDEFAIWEGRNHMAVHGYFCRPHRRHTIPSSVRVRGAVGVCRNRLVDCRPTIPDGLWQAQNIANHPVPGEKRPKEGQEEHILEL